MNSNLQNGSALVGRLLLAMLFVLSGFQKITGYSGTAGYMASAGLPMIGLLLPLTILIELGGGLLLVIGWQTRWVALVMFLFLIPVTLTFHNVAVDPTQMVMLLKNAAIMGGMLQLFAFGPGAWSIDGRHPV